MKQNKFCVKEVMTANFISVDSSSSINDAAKMMENSDVDAIMVMEGNELRGIITDRDFAIKVAAHAYPIDTPIRRVMSTPVISVFPEEEISTAAELMATRKIRKLPVVENDKVIGIITSADLIEHLKLSTNY